MTVAVSAQLEVSAADRMKLAGAVRDLCGLLCRDYAWTSILTDEIARLDVSAATHALGDLLTDLAAARAAADWLRDYVLTQRPQSVLAGIERAIDTVDDLDFRETAARVLSDQGPSLGALVEAGYSGIVEHEAAQLAALLQDASLLAHSQPTAGDLFDAVMCSAASLLVGGGMVMTAIPPHVHGPVIVTTGLAVYKTFKCREQPNAGRSPDPGRT